MNRNEIWERPTLKKMDIEKTAQQTYGTYDGRDPGDSDDPADGS